MRIPAFLAIMAIVFAVAPAWLRGATTEASDQRKHDTWLEPAESRTTIYDADPEHLWNRLHEAVWVRRDGTGRAIGRHRLDPLLWAETIACQLLQLEVRVPGTLLKIKTGDRIAFSFGDKSKLFDEGDPTSKTYRFEVDWDWKKEGVLATNLRVVSNKELKATR